MNDPETRSVASHEASTAFAPNEPTPAALTALERRFELLGEIGRGGMGIVYRARHRLLGQDVAIKVLQPGLSANRFLREARLLAQVKSPHVVAVHDFDILPDGFPVLIMEWIDGLDLARTLRDRPNPSEGQVTTWMRQVCDAMQAAADLGIVHRDLKPSNVFIGPGGTARVGDFGLARGESDGDHSLTASQGAMGTPHYMAPEQAEDPRSVDTRADIYSFGATFYHILTGKPPFTGPTPFSILYKHKTEPLTPPRARNPALSDRIDGIVRRCLAKSPHDRFASFAEIRRHLDSVQGRASSHDPTVDPELTSYLTRYHSRRQVYLNARMWPGEIDTYGFANGRSLLVQQGDLRDQRVDVLVNSINADLEMVGWLSSALSQAGGPTIRQEASRYGRVRVGRAVVTTAGNLPSKFIFHGVTISFDGHEQTSAQEVVMEIIASCFYHADTLNLQSIAFPMIGTGGAGFSPEACLDPMFTNIARTLFRGLTSINEARIIIFRP